MSFKGVTDHLACEFVSECAGYLNCDSRTFPEGALDRSMHTVVTNRLRAATAG